MKGPIFSQHFPTQVSPHYIQLEPFYYEFNVRNCTFESDFQEKLEGNLLVAMRMMAI